MSEFYLFKGILTVNPSSITSNNQQALTAYNSLNFSFEMQDEVYGILKITTNKNNTTKLRVAVFLNNL